MFKALKNRLFQLVAGLAFAAALMMSAGPAEAYYCAQLDPTGTFCILWTVDLLPSASWCAANPSGPASNEVLLYTSTGYYAPSASSATSPYCMRVVVNSGVQINDLSNYDLNGVQYHIQSIWVGTHTTVAFYSGAGGSGSSHGYTGGSNYYDNDIHAHLGWYPGSAILNHF